MDAHYRDFSRNGANDQDVPNAQDRIAAQYVMTAGSWVSESRFGWNLVDLDRWDAFFRVMDPNPNAPAEVSAFGAPRALDQHQQSLQRA